MSIISDIEIIIGDAVVSENSVSGGCISDSRIIETKSGNKYFLKIHSGNNGMFEKEANGLRELAKAECIRTPEVIASGDSYLLLENIEQGAKHKSFFTNFGHAFAQMHKYTSDTFGFYENNYIGSTPQYNIAEGEVLTNWVEFYYEYRILAQYKISEQKGIGTKVLKELVSKLENKIDSILGVSEETPSLLHGDLWGGNFLCDSDGGAVLIDPAVYYGHREADLAMTKMFGGFSPEFYESYRKSYPLKDGWEYRENIYLLYHYMNHYNLFGSGYYEPCVNILRSYIS